ncbi:MAG: hypothetical protein R6U57_00655 [Anaerolineales bacterium]
MESGLIEILDVKDVTACLLFDNQGQLLEEVGHMEGTLDALEAMGNSAVQTLATLKSEGSECRQMDYVFDRFRVVVNDLQKAVLVIICQPEVDISLLRLTMSVVTDRWDEDPRAQKYLDARAQKRLTAEGIAYGTEG